MHEFSCATNSKCISKIKFCDGENDCGMSHLVSKYEMTVHLRQAIIRMKSTAHLVSATLNMKLDVTMDGAFPGEFYSKHKE